jgi:hypothetical protein
MTVLAVLRALAALTERQRRSMTVLAVLRAFAASLSSRAAIILGITSMKVLSSYSLMLLAVLLESSESDIKIAPSTPYSCSFKKSSHNFLMS